jgi:hypothetical protein
MSIGARGGALTSAAETGTTNNSGRTCESTPPRRVSDAAMTAFGAAASCAACGSRIDASVGRAPATTKHNAIAMELMNRRHTA